MFDMAGGDDVEIPTPALPEVSEWTVFQRLNYEKEVVGIYISGHPMDDYELEVESFCDLGLKDLNEKINLLPNKEFAVAGIISNVGHLESRKGNKYGFFELQDMTGGMEFRIFGETYLKLSHFLTPGNFLYVKGNVQLKGKKFNPDGKSKEYSVQYMELLTNIRDKQLKKVHIRFDAALINHSSLDELEGLFETYVGDKSVYLDLIDYSDGTGVTLISRSKKVNVSNEFLKDLNEIMGYEGFSVNKSQLPKILNDIKKEQAQMKAEADAEAEEELVEDN